MSDLSAWSWGRGVEGRSASAAGRMQTEGAMLYNYYPACRHSNVHANYSFHGCIGTLELKDSICDYASCHDNCESDKKSYRKLTLLKK